MTFYKSLRMMFCNKKVFLNILPGPVESSAQEEATDPGSGLKITDLPPEILESIFAYLHPGDLMFLELWSNGLQIGT